MAFGESNGALSELTVKISINPPNITSKIIKIILRNAFSDDCANIFWSPDLRQIDWPEQEIRVDEADLVAAKPYIDLSWTCNTEQVVKYECH